MPYTRINSKRIKDLNISHNTIKILQENLGRKFSGIICSNIFANISPNKKQPSKGLVLENYRTLKKEIEEDTNKWKHIPCSQIENVHITQSNL